MVGFVVGEMALEQLKLGVDIPDESKFLSQEEDGADAAGTEPRALGVFVMDIGGRHHGYRPLGSGRIVESFLDSPPPFLEESLLACRPLFWRVRSLESPLARGIVRMCSYLHYSKNSGVFELFLQNRARRTKNHAWLRPR